MAKHYNLILGLSDAMPHINTTNTSLMRHLIHGIYNCFEINTGLWFLMSQLPHTMLSRVSINCGNKCAFSYRIPAQTCLF